MTPLRQRMLEELQRRNYSPSTTRGYILAVRQFAQYFRQSPEKLGAEEVRRFQLYMLKERKLSAGAVQIRMAALRFLYRKTLRRRDLDIDDLPFPKVPKKLPVVLSQEEVVQLIEAAPNLTYRTILMLLYGTGMRRGEVPQLRLSDIDSSRMVIHIRGKGPRDRDVPMSQKLLEALRDYYRRNKTKVYVFSSTPGRLGADQPISDKTVWHACRTTAKRAALKKRIGPHTMRHSFATHLMEAGANLLPLCRKLLHHPTPVEQDYEPPVAKCPCCQGVMKIVEHLTAAQIRCAARRMKYAVDSS